MANGRSEDSLALTMSLASHQKPLARSNGVMMLATMLTSIPTMEKYEKVKYVDEIYLLHIKCINLCSYFLQM